MVVSAMDFCGEADDATSTWCRLMTCARGFTKRKSFIEITIRPEVRIPQFNKLQGSCIKLMPLRLGVKLYNCRWGNVHILQGFITTWCRCRNSKENAERVCAGLILEGYRQQWKQDRVLQEDKDAAYCIRHYSTIMDESIKVSRRLHQ